MRHEGSTIVIFGAGNIGRGFIGQLFARSGWQIVFVDVNRELYIHNLGHAITAYHGNRVNPGRDTFGRSWIFPKSLKLHGHA